MEHENGDVLAAAEDLLHSCAAGDVQARLLGGVAIYLTCPSARRPELSRAYNDLDVVVLRSAAGPLQLACASAGFEGDRRFNSLHGDRRLLFRRGAVDVDCFVQVFEQCHKLDFSRRLGGAGPTISLADLLLTKLQIVEINRKDVTDALTILCDHEPGRGADAQLRLGEFLEPLTSDWGFYTTVSDNLLRLPPLAAELLEQPLAAQVEHRVQLLQDEMEAAPKTLSWKLRARVGRRVPWYELPEEKSR